MTTEPLTIYHNPGCSKSRQALALIREAGVEPEVIEYLQAAPTAEELHELMRKLKLEATGCLRRQEPIFEQLGLADRELTRDEAIAAMVAHPILIERPIVVRGDQAVIGRPPENVRQLL